MNLLDAGITMLCLHQGYFFEGDSLWFAVNPASIVPCSACPATACNKTPGDRNSGLELRARVQRHRARVRMSLLPNRNHADVDRDVIEFDISEVRTRHPICSSIPHANGLPPSMVRINSVKALPTHLHINSFCKDCVL